MTRPRVQRKRLKEGDEVWIPVAEINKTRPDFKPGHAGSVVLGKLAGRVDGEENKPGVPRTWSVSVAGLADAAGVPAMVSVSSRRMRRHSKILIFRIGDWETERNTLNPLAASLKAQLSLLVPPNEVDVEYIRTMDELAGGLSVHGGGGKTITARQDSPWGYAILVGHGRAGAAPGIRFGDRWHSPQEIVTAITGLGPGRRSFSEAVFVSLCCQTGEEPFAKPLSDELNTTFVGPGATVHSFEAAGFVQRLFYELFLGGETFAQALKRTREATTDFKTGFRCWLDGVEAQP
jgi:hypothetical protein